MQVVIESAIFGHADVQRLLTRVAKWRVPEVVGQRDRFRQILLQAELPGDGPADLCNLKAVRQTGAVVVVGHGGQHLRFAHETAEGGCVDNPLAVALKEWAKWVFWLRNSAAATRASRHRIWGEQEFVALQAIGRREHGSCLLLAATPSAVTG